MPQGIVIQYALLKAFQQHSWVFRLRQILIDPAQAYSKWLIRISDSLEKYPQSVPQAFIPHSVIERHGHSGKARQVAWDARIGPSLLCRHFLP